MTSEPPSPPRASPTAWSTALATALVLAARVRALLVPTLGYVDNEEGYNAAIADALRWITPSDGVILQYRPFCGGCTVDAALGRAVLAFAPPVALAWKAVPLLFAALGAALTFRLVHRAVGPVGAWASAVLLALAPTTVVAVSLRAWGNHVEAATIGLALLALVVEEGTVARAGAAGVLGALATWVSFSAGPFVATGALALRRRPRALAAYAVGLAAVALPWGVQVALHGEAPWTVLADPGASPARDAWGARVASLLAPTQIFGLLGDHGAGSSPVAGGVAALGLLVAVPVAARAGTRLARLLLAVVAVWTLAYLLGPFALETVSDRPRTGLELRYAVPVLLLVPLFGGLAAGELARRGRRLAAIATTAALAAGGVPVAASALAVRPSTDHLLRVDGADWAYFVRSVTRGHSGRLVGWRCPDDVATCLAVRAFDQGRVAGLAATGCAAPPAPPADAWWAGFAAGRADRGLGSGPPAAQLDALDRCLADAGVPAPVRADALDEAARVVTRPPAEAWTAAPPTPGWQALARTATTSDIACEPDPPPPVPDGWVAAVWARQQARLLRARLGRTCPDDDRGWPSVPGGSRPDDGPFRAAPWLPPSSPTASSSARPRPLRPVAGPGAVD